MSAWRPIETAPKDGRKILMARGSDIRIVSWSGWGGGVWMGDMGSHSIFDDATHWMPLPEPPEAAS